MVDTDRMKRDASHGGVEGMDELDRALSLAGLQIEDLEISEFLDETLAKEGDSVTKVMAASCTTCECCCSCILLVEKQMVLTTPILESHLSPDQVAKLQERGQGDVQARAEAAWPELLKQVSFAMVTEVEPASPQAQELAKRWMRLVHDFTGGDDKARENLVKMYSENPHAAKQFGPTPDRGMIEYITKCVEAAPA